jgi:hypothetical protein
MAMTPLPPLDPSSPTFRADVDAFFRTRMPAFVSEANAMQGNLNALAAGGALSFPMVGWENPATVKDGVGRFNIPGPQASVGNLFFNSLDLAGNNVLVVFSDLFANGNTNKGYVTFISTQNFGKRVTYRVIGYSIDDVNSRLVLGVAFVAQTGASINPNEAVVMQLSRNGDRGESGVAATMLIRDQVASGQQSQALAANTWTVRRFNTVVFNGISGAALGQAAPNTFTLPAGNYQLDARALCFGFRAHNIRLFNMTSSATHDVGVNENLGQYDGTGPFHGSTAELSTVISLNAGSTFRLDHFATNAATGAALVGGLAVNNGIAEAYAEIKITKVN